MHHWRDGYARRWRDLVKLLKGPYLPLMIQLMPMLVCWQLEASLRKQAADSSWARSAAAALELDGDEAETGEPKGLDDARPGDGDGGAEERQARRAAGKRRIARMRAELRQLSTALAQQPLARPSPTARASAGRKGPVVGGWPQKNKRSGTATGGSSSSRRSGRQQPAGLRRLVRKAKP